ncbi:conserved exported protein of unknown function [Tenacibaculum sp. 190524A02b]|uniref:hypothetical protein n=1 Tax=Tenacibaculum vairaonense TaxID=3137860 RepID=UPI0032B23779
MKTLKTIFGLLVLLTLTTSCTDLSEDLKLKDKIDNEPPTITIGVKGESPFYTGGGDGSGDGTDKE